MDPFPQPATQLGTVYIITNPAMPGMVKIGHTNQNDVKIRIDQLYQTGVPVPFEIEFACKAHNPEEIERALHLAFAPYRVNPKREFFSIEPTQAIAILKLLHVQDTTAEAENQPTSIEQAELNAGEKLRKKRPSLNFEEMQIPVGSVLNCTVDQSTVMVLSARKVRLNGEEMSLTSATQKVRNSTYVVAPCPYWQFNGQSLTEIYDNTYSHSIDE